jgi:signal transduction histidine kinase
MTELIVEKFYLFFQGMLLFQVIFFAMIYFTNQRKDTLIYCLMIFVTLLYFFLNGTKLFFNMDENLVYNSPAYLYINFALLLLMMFLYASFLFEIFRDGPGEEKILKCFNITKNGLIILFLLFVLSNLFNISSQPVFYFSHIANGPLILLIIYFNFNSKGFKSLIIKGMILIFACFTFTIYFTFQYNQTNNIQVSIFDKYPLLFIRIGMLADIFLFQLALLKRWNEQEKSLITKDFESKLALEKMRNQINVQLHDDVGSNLSSLNFLFEILKKKSNQSEQILEKISQNISETSSLLGDTIWAINPNYDSLQKVLERVIDFANNSLLTLDITFEHNIKSLEHEINLNADQRKNLYLTLKEAINNIAKHSKATKVVLEVIANNGLLTLILKDNGIGFNPNLEYQGNGIKNFDSREGLKIELKTEIGKGTMVIIQVKTQNH